jgi:(5-formylfuran-3-yl)methyl phosphate synthase
MTAMLASVRTVEEALLALEGGADIIDLKEPARGALGALDDTTARAIVAALRGRARASATIGDLPAMDAAELVPAAERTADTGVDIVKVGFFASPSRAKCAQALAPLTRRVPVVAVLFADLDPDIRLLDMLAGSGFAGVMLDTVRKDSGSLRRHFDDTGLREFIRHARSCGLFAGLAGSLREGDIAPLLALQPDYLGFRGALCSRAERVATLDADAFARVRRAIPRKPAEIGALRRLHGQPAVA